MNAAPIIAWSCGLLVICALAIDDTIESAAASHCYTDLAKIPHCRAAVVLGTSSHIAGGWVNLHYAYRLDAAAQLWHAGKVDWLVVSGDNSRSNYDEPSAMKTDLITRGVPGQVIYRDFAGFRTLDSVVRAQHIFGLDHFIIVSQPDHIHRAVYLARSQGIEAIGFAARSVDLRHGFKTRMREQLARVKAVLDVQLLATQPHFMGERIPVGDAAAN